jgi:hypothetical protein
MNAATDSYEERSSRWSRATTCGPYARLAAGLVDRYHFTLHVVTGTKIVDDIFSKRRNSALTRRKRAEYDDAHGTSTLLGREYAPILLDDSTSIQWHFFLLQASACAAAA